jgi:hypothetical protein
MGNLRTNVTDFYKAMNESEVLANALTDVVESIEGDDEAESILGYGYAMMFFQLTKASNEVVVEKAKRAIEVMGLSEAFEEWLEEDSTEED